MKFTRMIVVAFLAALLFVGTVFAGDSNPLEIKFTGYDVALVKLDPSHPVTDTSGNTKTYDQGYLVRVHGTFPVQSAMLFELYLDDERIIDYAGNSIPASSSRSRLCP
jgi:hypothetical protein